VDSVLASGWQANLSFKKEDGSLMKAGTKYWISVGPASTSCTDISGYLTAVRASGTLASDTGVLSISNVPIWPSQAAYDADAPGTTKSIFIITDGSTTPGTATWIEPEGLVFTKSCP
jgi:hypothetical protein